MTCSPSSSSPGNNKNFNSNSNQSAYATASSHSPSVRDSLGAKIFYGTHLPPETNPYPYNPFNTASRSFRHRGRGGGGGGGIGGIGGGFGSGNDYVRSNNGGGDDSFYASDGSGAGMGGMSNSRGNLTHGLPPHSSSASSFFPSAANTLGIDGMYSRLTHASFGPGSSSNTLSVDQSSEAYLATSFRRIKSRITTQGIENMADRTVEFQDERAVDDTDRAERQSATLRKRKTAFVMRTPMANVRVSSVDGFQGQEVDVVIFSTAVSQRPSAFAMDRNRINVALTRGRFLTIVLANVQALLKGESVWQQLVKHAQERGVLFEASQIPLFSQALEVGRDEAKSFYGDDDDFLDHSTAEGWNSGWGP